MTPELAKVLVANTWVPFPPKFPLLGTDSNDYPKKTDELYVYFCQKAETKAISTINSLALKDSNPPIMNDNNFDL